jgi:hypothetical protein
MSKYDKEAFAGAGRGVARVGIVPILLVLMLAVCMPLVAQSTSQEDEFGRPPPEGTGYVRLVNALPGSHDDSGGAQLSVGERRFGPVAAGEVTPYRPVELGVYQVEHGERSAEVEVRRDSYTTIALAHGAIFVIEDSPQEIPRLAQLVLYNLTQWRPLDLTVIPQGITALQAVPRGGASSIAVNPIEVTLGVRLSLPQEGRTAGSRPVGTVQLREGESFGVFAYLDDGGLTATLHRASVAVDE